MNFKLSYRDYIRRLQKSQSQHNDKHRLLCLELYLDYFFDVSCDEFHPISTSLLYRHNLRRNHDYELTDEKKFSNKKPNYYDELLDKDGVISTLLDTNNKITDDYLTGYYLTKILPKKQNNIVFFYGMSNISFLQGMEQVMKESILDLEWYGTDIRNKRISKLENYVSDVNKSCDMSDHNVVKSIAMTLDNHLANKKLQFYISDVYPKDNKMLFSSIYIPMYLLHQDLVLIIRLPDCHTRFDTDYINFMVFMMAEFSSVQIFKTPWGRKTRYYLIAKQPNDLSRKQLLMTKLYAYLKKDPDEYKFINKTYFTNEEGIDLYVKQLKELREHLMKYEKIDKYLANEQWIDTILNNEPDE